MIPLGRLLLKLKIDKVIEKKLKNNKNITLWLSPGGDGFEIVYALRNNDTLARKITQEIENTGQNVRKYYQRRLPSNSAKDYYYIIRETPNTEALLVEYGFLDSTGDDVSQLKNNYEELAEAVVKAVASYAGVPYTSKTDEYYTVEKGDTIFMGNNE